VQDVYDRLNEVKSGVKTDASGNVVSYSAAIDSFSKALSTKYANFATTVVFTATDYNTVTWTAGIISYDNGLTKSITAGTTGNFSGTIYIFFVPEDNTTQLYVQTVPQPVRYKSVPGPTSKEDNDDKSNKFRSMVSVEDKVTWTLLAMCTADANTSNLATVVPALGVITVGQLSAISANIGVCTAGVFRGGQTAYNTGTGFFLGFDGATPKFSLGNSGGDYLIWDGNNLQLNGSMSIVGSVDWSAVVDDGHKPEDDATVGATWGINLALIPPEISQEEPATSGLYLNGSCMGYWSSASGGAWKSYMDNSGHFYLAGTGTDSLTWNGATLVINGSGAFSGEVSASQFTLDGGSGAGRMTADSGLEFNDTDSPPTITKIWHDGILGTFSTVPTWNIVTVNGSATFSQITSTVPTGTAPLVVTSTTKVNNLNAALLDGHPASDFGGSLSLGTSHSEAAYGDHSHGSVYASATHGHVGSEIVSGVVPAAYGGTGANSGGWEGFPFVTAGSWSTKSFGTGAGYIAEGNHGHSGVYSPVGHTHAYTTTDDVNSLFNTNISSWAGNNLGSAAYQSTSYFAIDGHTHGSFSGNSLTIINVSNGIVTGGY
jgi:hypothetical protein